MSNIRTVKEKHIANHICFLRGHNVILDFDIASLYRVETRVLKQAVKRNTTRFPEDFMFPISMDEINFLVSQSVIPSRKHLGGAIPFAFTEQGLAMLSSVLNSEKAIDVNIAIMRDFVFVRQYSMTNKDLTNELKELEEKCNKQFQDVYEAINYLLKKDRTVTEQKERRSIGYKIGEGEIE